MRRFFIDASQRANKVQQLTRTELATIIPQPEGFEVPAGQGLVCVVENYCRCSFEVALYCPTIEDYQAAMQEVGTKKTWLLLPDERCKHLSGWYCQIPLGSIR